MRGTLMRFVEEYLSARDVSPTYAGTLRAHCRAFVRWHGRSIHIDEVKSDDVNQWIAELRLTKLKPSSVDGYRRNLLAVWRFAYEVGATDTPALRVRRLKLPRQIVRAYTHHEIRKLLHAAAQLKGKHRNGNKRADFWQALLHAAYSTALRRSDLLLVFRRDLDDCGTTTIVQSKTGGLIRVQFSSDALAHAARLKCSNGLLLPWPYRRDALVPRFNAIKKLAGISYGSLKWLRRSAASYAEREQPGAGSRILGHRTAAVYRSHYEDATIAGERPIQPPKL